MAFESDLGQSGRMASVDVPDARNIPTAVRPSLAAEQSQCGRHLATPREEFERRGCRIIIRWKEAAREIRRRTWPW